MTTRARYWSTYYADIVQKREPWLDYSNERVQVQTFGLAIDAAGPVRGKSCLDVGCGWGDFSRALRALRASKVTGIDIVPALIAEHGRTDPDITWLCGSLENPEFLDRLESYDLAFLLEVLQLVPLESTLRRVWDRVRPGGRLIGMVPNARCPIVLRARERFDANYTAPSLEDLDAALTDLPDLDAATYRGLWFSVDQRVAPYDASSWQGAAGWQDEPNRIQFAALKRPAPTA